MSEELLKELSEKLGDAASTRDVMATMKKDGLADLLDSLVITVEGRRKRGAEPTSSGGMPPWWWSTLEEIADEWKGNPVLQHRVRRGPV